MGNTKSETHDRLVRMLRVADGLEKYTAPNGYTRASLSYEPYAGCWFRDSSIVSMAYSTLGLLLKDYSHRHESEAWKQEERSSRILNFLWLNAIQSHTKLIERVTSMSMESDALKAFENHIPAVVGSDGTQFKGRFSHMPDRKPGEDGIKQHDSIPLPLLATYYHLTAFGPGKIEDVIRIISENRYILFRYMEKTYKSPCADIWEGYHDHIHAYDVAAVYNGIKSLALILDETGTRKQVKGLHPETETVLSEIDSFLRDFFIRDGILFKAKREFQEPIREVDASAIIINNHLRTPCITADVQKKTMAEIESQLFGGNTLPKRFKGDSYFGGGVWLLLGLEAALWYVRNNEPAKAHRIISYVEEKYLRGDSYQLPEQELTEPALDPEGHLARNNNHVISDLALSNASYIICGSALLDHGGGCLHPLLRH